MRERGHHVQVLVKVFQLSTRGREGLVATDPMAKRWIEREWPSIHATLRTTVSGQGLPSAAGAAAARSPRGRARIGT
jgi:hypothetical protein